LAIKPDHLVLLKFKVARTRFSVARLRAQRNFTSPGSGKKIKSLQPE
jgi:hypothetical protein